MNNYQYLPATIARDDLICPVFEIPAWRNLRRHPAAALILTRRLDAAKAQEWRNK